MREIGYSTGAIALGDFQEALANMSSHSIRAVELSALRVNEIRPLVDALPNLDLSRFSYVSLHVPSSFLAQEEAELVELLHTAPQQLTLVVHPDTISDYALWRTLSNRVALENMDRRKKCGRTAKELGQCFNQLPDARLCFDVGHARQFDPSMAEAYLILTAFADRLVQIHVSEVDSQSRHAVITYGAELAFKEISHLIPKNIPLILESRVSACNMEHELAKVIELFSYDQFPASIQSPAVFVQ